MNCWTLKLLPYLSNCEQCCHEYRGACSFSNECFLYTSEWNFWTMSAFYIPWSGISRPYGNLQFFEKPPYCFPQCSPTVNRLSFCPHPCQHLLLVSFLKITILTGVKGKLMLTSDVENLFMCLLSICLSSLEKCLFSASARFVCFTDVDLYELFI